LAAVILFSSGQLWLTFIVAVIAIVLSWLRLTWQQWIMLPTAKFTPSLYLTLWCPMAVTQAIKTQLILLK